MLFEKTELRLCVCGKLLIVQRRSSSTGELLIQSANSLSGLDCHPQFGCAALVASDIRARPAARTRVGGVHQRQRRRHAGRCSERRALIHSGIYVFASQDEWQTHSATSFQITRSSAPALHGASAPTRPRPSAPARQILPAPAPALALVPVLAEGEWFVHRRTSAEPNSAASFSDHHHSLRQCPQAGASARQHSSLGRRLRQRQRLRLRQRARGPAPAPAPDVRFVARREWRCARRSARALINSSPGWRRRRGAGRWGKNLMLNMGPCVAERAALANRTRRTNCAGGTSPGSASASAAPGSAAARQSQHQRQSQRRRQRHAAPCSVSGARACEPGIHSESPTWVSQDGWRDPLCNFRSNSTGSSSTVAVFCQQHQR